jgi:hypothetical protein
VQGSVQIPLPRRLDLDRDGIVDLLYVDWSGFKAALRRGAPDGSFARAVVWDLRPLVQPERGPDQEAAEDRTWRRALVDVLDADGDGILEAAVDFRPPEGEGIRGEMEQFRGAPAEHRLFPLAPDGSVAKEPSARISIVSGGIDTGFDHPSGWTTPYRDVDGDGLPELVTATIDLGYLGIAKGLITKKMKLGIVLHVYRRESGAWSEVSGAAPKFELTADLSDFDTTRFFRMPGDLDGDGREDIVQVLGREVQIHKGLPGARYSSRPTAVVRLEDKIRDFFGLFFVDLDGDGRREAIAFEEQPREKDVPARAVRMEIRPYEDVK